MATSKQHIENTIAQAEAQAKAQNAVSQQEKIAQDIWKRVKNYTPQNKRDKPPQPTITLLGTPVAYAGSLLLIVSTPAIGKSAVCEALIAAKINRNADTGNRLEFAVTSDGVLTYIDGERIEHHFNTSLDRALLRANATDFPSNVKPLLISEIDKFEERRDFLFEILESEWLRGGMAIIDGLGDYTNALNDEVINNDFLLGVTARAKAAGITIIATIHANIKDAEQKARGHLGSESLRRANAAFVLTRDNESGIVTLSARGASAKNSFGTNDLTIHFRWNDELGFMALCDSGNERSGNTAKRIKQIETLAKVATRHGEKSLSHSNLCTAIEEDCPSPISEATSKRWITELTELKVVRKTGKMYSIDLELVTKYSDELKVKGSA
jgi:hypothetical protein